MFSAVSSVGLRGIDGYLVQVEADVSGGLPGFVMVGVLASEVREAQDRVRTALKNSDYQLPARKVTVNLSPADVRKGGTGFDLPIAVGILAALGFVRTEGLKDSVITGELGLDGSVKPIRGILSIVSAAREAGMRRCFLPMENVMEGRAIPGMEIVGVRNIREMARILAHPEEIKGTCERPERMEEENCYDMDYAEVNGQLLLRRATEIAVAGRHNILYIGPAGTGKTMIAQRIPTIMPSLSMEERLEISKIYSICGMLPPSTPLIGTRPFRSPHHSVSPFALAGGGTNPRPGEISLASRGVLFLDELPEFQKQAIEILRQPLEEHVVTVARVNGSFCFPADFMLVAAMNPCNCGHYPDKSRCSCTSSQIKRYLGKVSKPILDRIDLCVEAVPLAYDDLKEPGANESSKAIRERVEQVRMIQKKRFEGSSIYFNSEMGGGQIRRFCTLSAEDEAFFKQIYQTMGLSARAYNKILKVARTIADMEGSDRIGHEHLCEAVGYRSLEEKYWNTGGGV